MLYLAPKPFGQTTSTERRTPTVSSEGAYSRICLSWDVVNIFPKNWMCNINEKWYIGTIANPVRLCCPMLKHS